MANWEPKIDFSDESLFGNEAAEDEDQATFLAYAYERPEVARFCDASRPIQIARAYKGEGKSALIRLTRSRVEASGDDALVIDTTGPQLSPDVESADFDKWLRAWKEALVGRAAAEVGARIGMAWTDDAIALVETAEKDGFKSKNFVSSIIDRLKPGAKERKPVQNAEAVLARWKGAPPAIWFFIDDLDRNFEYIDVNIAKLAAFFDACRQVSKAIPSFRFRLAIRPNTWTSLKLRSEALSHVEQYTTVISWSEQDILVMLGKRVRGYLERTGKLGAILQYLPSQEPEKSKVLVSLAFDTPIQWGNTQRPIHVALYTLSQHRPRWLVELARISARSAHSAGHQKVTTGDIFGQLLEFGKRRLEDTVAEFHPQCPEIGEILDGFRGQSEQYRTDELLTLIENRITNHINARIVGVSSRPTHRQVGSFLFQIGFLFARRDFEDGAYEHISFTDQPSLLVSRTDMDSGLSWEIPPVFRQALDLRTADGFERPKVSKDGKRKKRRKLIR